jgi:hypothetical protein
MEKAAAGKPILETFTEFLTNTFGSVGSLLQNGPSGLGAVVFVLVFLALIFAMVTGAAISPNLKALLNRFMALGTACFVISALTAFAGNYLGKEHQLMLTFSPDFEVDNLPAPTFKPNNGKGDFKSGYIFAITKDSQIQINFDKAIKAVKALKAENVAVLGKLSEVREFAASQATQVEALTQTFKTVAAAKPKLSADESRALDQIGGRLIRMNRNMQVP